MRIINAYAPLYIYYAKNSLIARYLLNNSLKVHKVMISNASLFIFFKEVRPIMLGNLIIAALTDALVNIAEAASSLASNILWHEPECPEELLK